jgi:heavy metal sensor kinase
VLALLLAAGGGIFLAGRALAPVDRITRAARRIEANDLSQRLQLDLPDDELGRLATAFDEMIDRLDQAFQRQRRFTADASHELRTPLAVIRSQLDVALARRRSPEYYQRLLDSLREETERLSGLVESLLMLARADAGQALTLREVDLEEIAAETVARVATQMHEHGLELGVTIQPIGQARGDAVWLSQLLLNLLDNALRHTPPGGQVALTLQPAEHGAQITVSDTGEGIAPEHLPRLFERFYRIDKARSRTAGGAGLGLAICNWVARAHHGRLDVESTPGQGTTFTLWLPAGPAPQAVPEASLEVEAEPALALTGPCAGLNAAWVDPSRGAPGRDAADHPPD